MMTAIDIEPPIRLVLFGCQPWTRASEGIATSFDIVVNDEPAKLVYMRRPKLL